MNDQLIPTDDPRLLELRGDLSYRYGNRHHEREYVIDEIVKIKALAAREELERLAKERGIKVRSIGNAFHISFRIPGSKWGLGVGFAGRRTGRGSRHYSPEKTTIIQCVVDDSYGDKKVFPEGKKGLSFEKILDEIERKIGWKAREIRQRKKEQDSYQLERAARAAVAESMNLSYEHQVGDLTGKGEIKVTLNLPLDVYPEIIAFLEEKGVLGKLYRKERTA